MDVIKDLLFGFNSSQFSPVPQNWIVAMCQVLAIQINYTQCNACSNGDSGSSGSHSEIGDI